MEGQPAIGALRHGAQAKVHDPPRLDAEGRNLRDGRGADRSDGRPLALPCLCHSPVLVLGRNMGIATLALMYK